MNGQAIIFWTLLVVLIIVVILLWLIMGYNTLYKNTKRTTVQLDEAAPQMQTGDLILFSNNNFPLMKMIFKNEWTHVALVMRHPKTGVLYLFESIPSTKDNRNLTDEISLQKHKDGPQLLPLLDRVRGYRGYAAWRPLQGLTEGERNAMWTQLMPLLYGISDQKFEKAISSVPLWFNLADHLNGKDRTEWFHSVDHSSKRTGVFCSEMIASALSYVGLLSTERADHHCSTFAPGTFALGELPYQNTKARFDPQLYELNTVSIS